MREGSLTAAPPCTPDTHPSAQPSEIAGSTELRAAVLAALRERPESISVYALLDLVDRRAGKPRHANSIYRILDHLTEADLAIHVVSLKRYMARPPSCGRVPLLLLCRLCDRIEVVSDPSIERDVAALATRERF